MINTYRGFFWFDVRGAFTSTIIYLYQVFDTHSRTVNLKSILGDAPEAGVPNDKIDEAWELLNNAKVPFRGLRILRHNIFAHRSSDLGYGDAFAMAQISPNQLRGLTETSLKILNILARGVGLDEEHFLKFSHEHLVKMLDVLRRS